ncbi:hypothetical protein Aph01nite_11570 [Acrocarpospora phusangensis]|uniref:Uncharacterized protein n=1 Tax=Acrocarpospora phusangensis TaxID=1070424 RepID=A0A919UM24_9ACTN|nr:hypothetical protein [Acrocarpospora phusangensis]GIH22847.1 hypothetical protein Aph01nite_11570 [Acrocarpospora phusangensis]
MAVLVLPLAGACASGQDGQVSKVAGDFYAAVRGGDGVRACALLTESAAQTLTPMASAEGECATALLKLRLPGAGKVEKVAVWGNEAQARLTGDTLFLHRSAQGWRIRAGGCRPQDQRPYQCAIG